METVTTKQFDKLEDKVEKLDDKVDDLKEDISVLRSDVRIYARDVRAHVAGDQKIISEILPTIESINVILPELKAIVMEANARRINQQIEAERKKKLKSDLTIMGTVVTIIAGIIGFFYKP